MKSEFGDQRPAPPKVRRVLDAIVVIGIFCMLCFAALAMHQYYQKLHQDLDRNLPDYTTSKN